MRPLVRLSRHGTLWALAWLLSACATVGGAEGPPSPQAALEHPPAPQQTQAERPPTTTSQVEVPAPAPPEPVEGPPAQQPPPAQPPAAEAPKPPAAPTAPQPPPRMLSFRFEEADLEPVLKTLAELAGINVVLAPGVKAKVTMWIDRVPATEAFAILQGLFEANNLVAVRSGPEQAV